MKYLTLILFSAFMVSCSQNNSGENATENTQSDDNKENSRYNNMHNLDNRAAVFRGNMMRR